MRYELDNLLESLYSSNDPLCYDAAMTLESVINEIDSKEDKLKDIVLATKYMLESLIEINRVARDRDGTPGPVKIEEYRLRLRECGNIAMDTINLKSVKKAYERMYNE